MTVSLETELARASRTATVILHEAGVAQRRAAVPNAGAPQAWEDSSRVCYEAARRSYRDPNAEGRRRPGGGLDPKPTDWISETGK